MVLRGTREQTRAEALRWTRALAPERVIWAAPDAPPAVRSVSPRMLHTLLGQSVDAAVLDLHGAIDPDAIARAEGLIEAGGALLLRTPPAEAPIPRRADFAVHPHTQSEVGDRFARRFARLLPPPDHTPLADVPRTRQATPEQDALVAELAEIFANEAPTLTMLLADRGRGKSAALGRAIRAVHGRGLRVVVTGPREEAVREVLAFAAPASPELAAVSTLAHTPAADVIVIDEAAQLPVATIKRITLSHPAARIALATTCHGYEGTGRGFALRFATWARTCGRPIVERTLAQPIRWAAGDPLERWSFASLLLDAEPASLGAPSTARHVVIDRERLADDERTLRQLFGLLVHAHYRTTPSDLARLLDAPNMSVHALFEGDDVVAATLLAREGGLPTDLARAMQTGARRVAGHALADTLVSHALRPDVASLAMVRSVRVAVHEARRGRGLARQLVEAVHAMHQVDLFGTIFGATPDLIAFRRALGYRVVRVGVARGARSGEPAVVMVRPVTEAADAMVAALEVDLARELDAQLALVAADEGAPFPEPLRHAIALDLPSPRAPEDAAVVAIARGYATSTQPLDVVAASLARFVALHEARDPVLRARLLDRTSWREAATRASLPSVEAAMRHARAAVRALLHEQD